MTYKEIKQRLTQCEVKLQQLQAQDSPARKAKNYNTAVEKLHVLKESLEKQLAEAEDGMVRTSDPAQAEKLAKKGLNVDLKTEQDGVEFSKEETAAIAKEVGKALAKALHSLGDEIDSMKARNLEPNSFEIYVQYKKDTSDDQFSFYISEDTLHLVDFSFDKEIGGVGIKPSGEAIVHVDVLANELIKHFRSLTNEGMSDQEYADAKEADRLEKHPEKSTIEKIRALIAAEKTDESIFDTPRMGGFHNSKGVAGHISNTHKQDQEYAASNRKAYKKDSSKDEMKHPSYKSASNQYAGRTKGVKLSADEKEAQRQSNRDFIQRLKDKGMLEEAPEGRYYFEVSKDDSTRALFIMDLLFRPEFEKTGKKGFNLSRNVYTFEDSEAAAAAMKLLQDRGGVEIIDTNIDLDKNKDLNLSEAPEGRYYIKVAVRDARKALNLLDDSPAYSAAMELDGSDTYYFDDEQLAYDAMMDLSAHGIEVTDNNIDLDENKAHDEGGDLDIGHQDDEPDMLKQNVYDIATYA